MYQTHTMKIPLNGLVLSCLLCTLSLQMTNGQNSDYLLIRSENLLLEPSSDIWFSMACYNCGAERFLSGIRIDSSAQSEVSSTHYFNKEIVPLESGCYVIGPSILGDSIVEDTLGKSMCYTMDGREIVLNRYLNIGESDTMFVYADSSYISLTLATHLEEFFLGVLDSVKTFSLQKYSKEDSPVEDRVNDLNIKISKSHGGIQLINFRDFPVIRDGSPVFELISDSQLNSASLYLTYGDIYDFEVGDEFHYQNENVSLGPGRRESVVRRVVGKDLGNTDDTIVYTFYEHRWGYKLVFDGNGDFTNEYFSEERTYLESFSNLTDSIFFPHGMPSEAVISEYYVSNKLMFRNVDIYNNRFVLREEGFNLEIRECMNPPHDSYGGSYTYYIVGCGHIFNHVYAEMEEECIPCEHLVYYKKGNEVWGAPLSINAANGEINNIVYPNPASSSLIIEFDNPEHKFYQLSVYDNLGRQVLLLGDLIESQIEINVEEYASGLYYFRLLGEEMKQGSRGKFLVK